MKKWDLVISFCVLLLIYAVIFEAIEINYANERALVAERCLVEYYNDGFHDGWEAKEELIEDAIDYGAIEIVHTNIWDSYEKYIEFWNKYFYDLIYRNGTYRNASLATARLQTISWIDKIMDL